MKNYQAFQKCWKLSKTVGNKLILLLFIGSLLNPAKITAQVQTGSFMFDGVLRDYIVFLPQKYNGVDKLPLVFNLHGSSVDAQWQMNYSLMNEVADTAGFIVVYPNAVGAMWNIDSYTVNTVNDLGFISSLIDTLEANFNIDLSRVYCCGLSRGGGMARRLVSDIGHLFTAMADVAGSFRIGQEYHTLRPFPVLICHGTLDPVSPYDGDSERLPVQKNLDFWIQQNGCQLKADTVLLPDLDPNDGCVIEKINYSNCNQESSILFFKVIGGGHQWPGAASGLNPYGHLNEDINLSAEIWGFFKEYDNPLVDLANAKSLELSRKYKYFSAQIDTLPINAYLSNPKNHQVEVYATIQADGSDFKDSIKLFDDGLHDDGNASDNFYSGSKQIQNLKEDNYTVKLKIYDSNMGKSHEYYAYKKFTTAGPVKLDSLSFTKGVLSSRVKPYVHNWGNTKTIPKVSMKLTSNDPWLKSNEQIISIPDIPSGATVASNSSFIFQVVDSIFPGYFNFKAEIMSDGWTYWIDSTKMIITGIKDEVQQPLTFKLEQNYPNPFNPTTKISWQSPVSNRQILKVFDVLGNEVATLVDEYKPAGSYELEFDASLRSGSVSAKGGYASGVYFYQLRAGSFVETKKMILMR